MNKEIKAIIFDYGGVFTRETKLRPMFEHCAKKYGKEIDENFLAQIMDIWDKEQVVKTPKSLFWHHLGNFFGVSAEEVLSESAAFYGFQWDVLELAKELKGKYKVGMITNNIAHWFEENIKEKGMDKIFDDIVTSYGAGVAKPNRAIYDLSVNNLGVLAEECVFIDDSERNIIGAQNAGMQAILFHDLEQLKDELKMFGIA